MRGLETFLPVRIEVRISLMKLDKVGNVLSQLFPKSKDHKVSRQDKISYNENIKVPPRSNLEGN